jgi:uncharacterized protein (TIGR01777 family)
MLPAFRKFAGGPLGSGQQWFPWIHMDDLLLAVNFLLRNDSARGAYNFSSPGVVRQNEFARSLGAVLKRPAILPAPTPMLRLMMGEMAALMLASQRMIPQRLMDEGFQFQFPDIETALADLVPVK